MSQLYLTVLLIIFSYCICINCKDVTNPSGPGSCKGLELSEGSTQCCYLRRKYHSVLRPIEDYRACLENNAEIDWKKFMDDLRKVVISAGGIIDEWDCQCFDHSNYITISLLSLLLFLLF